jgi:hypothetical protein
MNFAIAISLASFAIGLIVGVLIEHSARGHYLNRDGKENEDR